MRRSIRGGPRSNGRVRITARGWLARYAGGVGAVVSGSKSGACVGAFDGAISMSNANVMQQPGAHVPPVESGDSSCGCSSPTSLQQPQHWPSDVVGGASSWQHETASTLQHSPRHAVICMWLPIAANSKASTAIQRIGCVSLVVVARFIWLAVAKQGAPISIGCQVADGQEAPRFFPNLLIITGFGGGRGGSGGAGHAHETWDGSLAVVP